MAQNQRRVWGVWNPGTLPPITPEMIRARAARTGAGIAATEEAIALMQRTEKIVLNDLYQVNIRDAGMGMVHLSIKRLDKQPMGPERFRHFQRIKNELVGPECEGVEVYPAESRLIDTSNQYHLFVFADPRRRFPFAMGGATGRMVIADSGDGAIQQPFEDTDA